MAKMLKDMNELSCIVESSAVDYDYLIVGSGLWGCTFARLMTDCGYRCLVIEKRNHIAGNCYTESRDGIMLHRYGPHIFNTSSESIWQFINRFCDFHPYVYSPVARYLNKLYPLPFNMNTFYSLWGSQTPEEAKKIIESQQLKLDREPRNLEEQALSTLGYDLYNILVKGYTQKQWKCHPSLLPAQIIKRIPLRFTFDNNYFNTYYQGIPKGGYTELCRKMLNGIKCLTSVDYFANRAYFNQVASFLVFTGRIDEFFDYEYGELNYRTLRFVDDQIESTNHQGNSVINYTGVEVEYTRVIEHRHFAPSNAPSTIITYEYPDDWNRDKIPYYPMQDQENMTKHQRYKNRATEYSNLILGGRLAEYRYYNMDQAIASAMKTVKSQLQKNKK